MNHPNDLSIAAIIPTFRRDKYLYQTIQKLLEQTRIPDEIIIIDQTPVEEQDHNIRNYLDCLEREGIITISRIEKPAVSVARNVAIGVAESDILLYLDDDIIPDKRLIECHLRNYNNENIDGVVGSVFPPGVNSWISFPNDFFNRSLIWQSFYFTPRYDVPLSNVGFMLGGNFSVRNSSIKKIGGWDENIINYGDRDLGLRMSKAGYRIDYEPRAKIIHLSAPIGGTRVTDPKTPWKGYQRCVSVFYLAFRHLTMEPRLFIKFGLWRAARFSILLKENAFRPWRWPFEMYSYFKAMYKAYQDASNGLKSPYILIIIYTFVSVLSA
jgi:GT2 family glycosyltransferase